MTSEELFELMGDIDEKHIQQAQAAQNRGKPVWLKFTAAAAACIGLALACVLPMSGDRSEASPFVLTAYAVESSGALCPNIMEQDVAVPLGEIETETGKKGFFFSCPLHDPNSDSFIMPMSAEASSEMPAEKLNAIIEEKGVQYFFYVPVEEDGMPAKFIINIYNENRDWARYKIVITEEESGYSATLEDVIIRLAGEY